MSCHRPIVPFRFLIACVALSACQPDFTDSNVDTAGAIGPVGSPRHSSSASDRPDYTKVFPRDQVRRLDITVVSADWQALQRDLAELFVHREEGPSRNRRRPPSRSPIHIPCTVDFEGQRWHHVALFAQPGQTLTQTLRRGIKKLPLGLRFDELGDRYPDAKDQRFHGFRALSLGNNADDLSFLRQRAAHETFRGQSVPTPYAAFYRVYVDMGAGAMYFGLYTAVETLDAPFLSAQFGDPDGNLYRAANDDATFRDFSEAAFVKETNGAARDYSDIKSAITALHHRSTDPATWRAQLEKRFDVNGFLNWLAVNTVIENADAYGITADNYYLYADKRDGGRLTWIPGDSSQALRSGPHRSLSLSLREIGPEWPLIRYLLDDPVYRATYLIHVEAVAAATFSRSEIEPWYRNMHALIAPYVTGPQGELASHTFLRSSQDFDRSVDDLVDHLSRRQAAVSRFLSAR